MEKDNTGLSGVLLKLAERCEREEPSRELDAAIFIAVYIDAGNTRRIDQDGGIVGWWPFNKPYVAAREVPAVTKSLDAAVTLVPEGASWSVTVQGACEAEVTILSGRFLIDGDIERYGRSGVPAKALCTAALRARAALLTDGAEPDTAKAVTK